MLKERTTFTRTWMIANEGERFRLNYNGWGFGYETVSIDGKEYSRRCGWGQMSQRFEFTYANHKIVVSIAVPWLGEALLLCGLSFVQVQIDGYVVYQEGVEPARLLPVTKGLAS